MFKNPVPGKQLPVKFCRMERKCSERSHPYHAESKEQLILRYSFRDRKASLLAGLNILVVCFIPKPMCILIKALDLLKSSEKLEYVQMPLFWEAS